jgi:hypothetical protein
VCVAASKERINGYELVVAEEEVVAKRWRTSAQAIFIQVRAGLFPDACYFFFDLPDF